MKTRDGFVSNSSSTSFTVGFNGKPPNKKEILEMFGVEEHSPLRSLAWELSDFFAKRIRDLEKHETDSKDDWERECAERDTRLFKEVGLTYQGFFRCERDFAECNQPMAGWAIPWIKNEKLYIVNHERGDMR